VTASDPKAPAPWAEFCQVSSAATAADSKLVVDASQAILHACVAADSIRLGFSLYVKRQHQRKKAMCLDAAENAAGAAALAAFA
jgi:hypothetical protein